ncbi:MAG: Ktr system potassium uptake protein A [Pelotomaculum sp. PtaB.Bin104]|nr:MAG: Ktr system potassium uptake protein A [Pelotomaculum sp. PtaB.Bin104]
MKYKQVAIIGLGRFGMSLLTELSRMGCDVLAIDNDVNNVNEVAEIATHTIQADSMDEQVLKSLGIRNFDIVIVAIGENVQASILTTIILKELGVKKIVAKAKNALHGKVLEKVGADCVVFPERDMAIKLAKTILSHHILDHIELSPQYSIEELLAPKIFINKSIEEIDVRKKMKVSILAIKRGDEVIVVLNAREVIKAGDILVALGKNEDLQRLDELES